MTLKQLELYFIEELKLLYGTEEAAQMFYLTAEHLSALSRTQVMQQSDSLVDPELKESYQKILSALKDGRPLQYVFAEAWFYGLKFKVSGAVLIPRQETEELVHWILETAEQQAIQNFLDVGTGSGCIAVALKKNLPAAKAEALDISSEALEIAIENAATNQTDINFIQGDILGYESIAMYDLIVSNPPYITPKERAGMHQNVLEHEPELALFVTEEDPLIFYQSIAEFALKNLNPQGFLFFEINEYLGKEMIDMLSIKGFSDIQLRKDMQGKDRMIRCAVPEIRSLDEIQ